MRSSIATRLRASAYARVNETSRRLFNNRGFEPRIDRSTPLTMEQLLRATGSSLHPVRAAHIGAPLCTEDEGEDAGLRPASREKDLPSPYGKEGAPANRADVRADHSRDSRSIG